MFTIHRLSYVWFLCFAAAVLSLMPPACRADDESLTGVGGTIEALSPNPSIRMVEEHVDIEDVTAPHVTARFVFKNEGPATNALIGFPEMGDQIAPGKPESPGLDYFRSFVDGKPITVRRRMARRKPRSLSEFDYVAWYLKRVHFAAHQTHVIVDEYYNGGGATGEGLTWFTYVLRSGASWKGPIGKAVITADLGPLVSDSPVSISPGGYRRSGSHVTWVLRNFKPKHNIEIEWYRGFIDIAVNGQYPYSGGNEWYRPQMDDYVTYAVEPDDILPVKRHRDIWLPLQVAAKFLGASWQVEKPGQVLRILSGKQWVDIRIGSHIATRSDGKQFVMVDPAAYQSVESGSDSLAMVDLIPLAKAFGGTAEFTSQGTHLSVHVPNKNAPARSDLLMPP